MDDPMTRSAAIRRIVAMRSDSGQTWDLSPKDQEALRHAVQAFSDVDALREELLVVHERNGRQALRIVDLESALNQILAVSDDDPILRTAREVMK